MLGSGTGVICLHFPDGKSHPGDKRPEFSISLFEDIWSMQQSRRLAAVFSILICTFILFFLLREFFSGTLRLQASHECFAAAPSMQLKAKQPSAGITLSEMSSGGFLFSVETN